MENPSQIYERDLSYIFFSIFSKKKTPPPPPKPESPTSNNQLTNHLDPPGSSPIRSVSPAYHAIIPSPSFWVNGFTDGAQKPGVPTNMETWKWWVSKFGISFEGRVPSIFRGNPCLFLGSVRFKWKMFFQSFDFFRSHDYSPPSPPRKVSGKKILHGGVIEPTKTHPSDTRHRKGLKLDKSLRVTGSSPRLHQRTNRRGRRIKDTHLLMRQKRGRRMMVSGFQQLQKCRGWIPWSIVWKEKIWYERERQEFSINSLQKSNIPWKKASQLVCYLGYK